MRRARRRPTPARCATGGLAIAALLTFAGCGGGGEQSHAAEGGEITVSAAASLTEAFEAYAAETPSTEHFSFAGSDQLAAQIRQGAAPDVYAAASTELPQALHDEGLVTRPTVFATNALVLAVPTGSEIDSIADLASPDVDLVLGTEGAPFGAYAREAIGRLHASRREAILANVRSEEPDAKAAVGKVAQGAADAAFVYRSDVEAAGEEVVAIELPPGLEPEVAYAAAVVRGAENPDGARELVEGLVSGPGARALGEAGFGPPPAHDRAPPPARDR